MFIKQAILSVFRKIRIFLTVSGKSNYLTYGRNLHLGANVRLWAPEFLEIGDNVYIGKDVHIECNTMIGSNSLIANRVALIGKNDHDYRCIGTPVRFSPWVGMNEFTQPSENRVEIGEDVWIGFGAIIMTGVKIGKGVIIAAGSIVTKDIPDYSVAGGVPAKIMGTRFEAEEIKQHEMMIAKGEFEYSLMGLKYSIVNPGEIND